MLFGIGTDYILFLLFRYRERLRAGEDPKQAMVSAVARVGEVIASAAGVVIAAFLALLLSTLGVLRSIGPALAIAVAVMLIAGLTLVPAVVSLLGPRVFWPSKAWRREPKARPVRGHRPLPRRAGPPPTPSSPAWSWPSWPSARSATSRPTTCPRPASPATPSRRRRCKTSSAAATGRDRPDRGTPAPTVGRGAARLGPGRVRAKLQALPGVGAVAAAHAEHRPRHRRLPVTLSVQPALHRRDQPGPDQLRPACTRPRPPGR